MKVTRCDMCGEDVTVIGGIYLGIAGHSVLKYTGRDGREHSRLSLDLDLCEKCARKVMETIDGMMETEG